MGKLSYIIYGIVFIISVSLVVIGQKNIGPAGIGVMLLGLSGLLVLLGIYNKRYQ